MAKTIYTERDVEDLAQRGGKEIVLTDNIYLTDLARERAEKLGIALRVEAGQASGAAAAKVGVPSIPRENVEEIIGKVKADVIAKLGPSVDPTVIDRIVRRIVGQLK
jgi:hypothetical protein